MFCLFMPKGETVSLYLQENWHLINGRCKSHNLLINLSARERIEKMESRIV